MRCSCLFCWISEHCEGMQHELAGENALDLLGCFLDDLRCKEVYCTELIVLPPHLPSASLVVLERRKFIVGGQFTRRRGHGCGYEEEGTVYSSGIRENEL